MASRASKPSGNDGAAPAAPGIGRPRLYTAEERRRRDATPWTLVQGVLAPVQFVVFLVSVGLILRYFATGAGYDAAVLSVVAKTFVLYAIMITGSIWEKAVFGRWLFAPAFFWEDVVSIGVLALHTVYLVMLFRGIGTVGEQFAVALAGYGAYAVNAAQFLLKLRAARLEAADRPRTLSMSDVAAQVAS
ncbi:2-vinyl bacteriochlorophyllide hydratase [Aurantimonas sp. VKM B-3413]|uniref:2-vinyl bacteriochlorophyllide hydratase n=1 Tax=Aurantimonas sp. VKM B-3413 TaxID=2779401 RepID=UPI001E4D06E4|nr:2-vinyl bacteriochlorophyllide hydratase [Aurantimonas sp. VKM B-3413]MCB8839080.1 2-vinyl bacteriochlorophyllide hydratase [Aurantimonas sp. VKM B-3413]